MTTQDKYVRVESATGAQQVAVERDGGLDVVLTFKDGGAGLKRMADEVAAGLNGDLVRHSPDPVWRLVRTGRERALALPSERDGGLRVWATVEAGARWSDAEEIGSGLVEVLNQVEAPTTTSVPLDEV